MMKDFRTDLFSCHISETELCGICDLSEKEENEFGKFPKTNKQKKHTHKKTLTQYDNHLFKKKKKKKKYIQF